MKNTCHKILVFFIVKFNKNEKTCALTALLKILTLSAHENQRSLEFQDKIILLFDDENNKLTTEHKVIKMFLSKGETNLRNG